MADDLKLLREYRDNRAPEAFAELVGRHAGIVYGAAVRITGNAHDAEDVAQECFLALARDGQTEPRLLSAWLHRLAVNRALNLNRGKARRHRHELAAAEEKLEQTQVEPRWDDIAPYVDEALNELPEDLRLPLILHFLHERTQDEIGSQLSVDRSTVSRRIDKGIDQLRMNLRRLGVTVATAAMVALLGKNMAQAAPSLPTATLATLASHTNTPRGRAAAASRSAASIAVGALLAVTIILAIAWLAATPPTHPTPENDTTDAAGPPLPTVSTGNQTSGSPSTSPDMPGVTAPVLTTPHAPGAERTGPKHLPSADAIAAPVHDARETVAGAATRRPSPESPQELAEMFVAAVAKGDVAAVKQLYPTRDEFVRTFAEPDAGQMYDAHRPLVEPEINLAAQQLKGAVYARWHPDYAQEPTAFQAGHNFGPVTLAAATQAMDNTHVVVRLGGRERDLKIDEMILIGGAWRLLGVPELRPAVR